MCYALFESLDKALRALSRPSKLFTEHSVLSLISVRLACVRHAASVRPEPGSNSLKYGI